MGHHYVPQDYLKRFADPDEPGMIWMYDKKFRQFQHVPIKVAAQESSYYTPEHESMLAEEIEGPTHHVFEQLCVRKQSDLADRWRFARYVATMMTRGPRRRRKACEDLPEVLEETMQGIHEQIDCEARARHADPALVFSKHAEFDEMHERFSVRPPNEIVDQYRDPRAYLSMIKAVFDMCWRLVSTDRPDFFLTSDNPAYFFDAYGLRGEGAEVVFPLACNLALHGGWDGVQRATIFLSGSRQLVLEFNRRIASGAERFVFCHQRKPWIAAVANKRDPFLSRIQWRTIQ